MNSNTGNYPLWIAVMYILFVLKDTDSRHLLAHKTIRDISLNKKTAMRLGNPLSEITSTLKKVPESKIFTKIH